MSKNVRYEKAMRERASQKKKWLVTVAVDGKHLGDDSCCVQALCSLPKAKELTALALNLLKGGRG